MFTNDNGEIKTLNLSSGMIKLLASENDEAIEYCHIEPKSLKAVTGGEFRVHGWNLIKGKKFGKFDFFGFFRNFSGR